MSTIYDIPLKTNKGVETTLEQYKGKVLYIFNSASKCGLTGQLAGLVDIQTKYGDDVVVLGFPANDFKGQEPGDDEQVAEFCQLNYKTNFPMFTKASVLGETKQPLYAKLIELQPNTIKRQETVDMLAKYNIEASQAPEVAWNFEKFIVNKDGSEILRFAPTLVPDAEEIVAAIEKFRA